MHLAVSTGMAIEDVRDQFDLPRLEAFRSYSERNPPVHVMIARYFGIGKDAQPQALKNNDDELTQLFAQLPILPS